MAVAQEQCSEDKVWVVAVDHLLLWDGERFEKCALSMLVDTVSYAERRARPARLGAREGTRPVTTSLVKRPVETQGPHFRAILSNPYRHTLLLLLCTLLLLHSSPV